MMIDSATAESTEEILAQPPRYPSMSDRDFGVGFRRSIFIHVAIALLILVKSLVFPGKPVQYIPTLRVDIVGLPDLLKKDMAQLRKAPPPLPSAEQLAQAQKDAEKIRNEPKPAKVAETAPVERAEKDEMVLHPKRSAKEKPQSNTQKKAHEHDSEKNLVKKNKYALARIKALEKLGVEGSTHEKSKADSLLIKGNAVSKGSSLSGDAKEASEESYLDTLRDKLQENWALPVWLSRQNLSARVQLFLDARGRLRNFRIIKPSGNAQFDEAVKRSVQESQPFPPPPTGIASSISTTGVMVGFPL